MTTMLSSSRVAKSWLRLPVRQPRPKMALAHAADQERSAGRRYRIWHRGRPPHRVRMLTSGSGG